MSMRGRDSITATRIYSGLDSLEKRRQAKRRVLLQKVSQEPDLHPELSGALHRCEDRIQTRASRAGKPSALSASTSAYYGSFLSRTIRETISDCTLPTDV